MTSTKVCPFCAEEIKAAAIKCKHCESSLPKTSESGPPEGKTANEASASPIHRRQAAPEFCEECNELRPIRLHKDKWVCARCSPRTQKANNPGGTVIAPEEVPLRHWIWVMGAGVLLNATAIGGLIAVLWAPFALSDKDNDRRKILGLTFLRPTSAMAERRWFVAAGAVGCNVLFGFIVVLLLFLLLGGVYVAVAYRFGGDGADESEQVPEPNRQSKIDKSAQDNAAVNQVAPAPTETDDGVTPSVGLSWYCVDSAGDDGVAIERAVCSDSAISCSVIAEGFGLGVNVECHPTESAVYCTSYPPSDDRESTFYVCSGSLEGCQALRAGMKTTHDECRLYSDVPQRDDAVPSSHNTAGLDFTPDPSWVPYEERYPNGQLMVKGYETTDSRGKVTTVGPLVGWYENGQKKYETSVENGQVGLATEWYSNGQKKSEVRDKDGKREGTTTTWYDNGHKQVEVIFANDLAIEARCWARTGHEISCDEMPKGE